MTASGSSRPPPRWGSRPPCGSTSAPWRAEQTPCFGEAIAERSGYGHLGLGDYPPCVGWLARQRAWGEAWSPRFRFTVDREPVEGCPCRYVVRRNPRAAPLADSSPA